MNYYEILEVGKNASPEVINMAYKALIKKYHPDVYQGPSDEANIKMQELNEARDILLNPNKRKAYDEWLEAIETAQRFAEYESFRAYEDSRNSKSNEFSRGQTNATSSSFEGEDNTDEHEENAKEPVQSGFNTRTTERKKDFSGIISFVIAFSIIMVAYIIFCFVGAPSKSEELYEIYNNILDEQIKYYESYSLSDLNQNGTPELLLYSVSENKTSEIMVYTLDYDDEVCSYGPFEFESKWCFFEPKCGCIVDQTSEIQHSTSYFRDSYLMKHSDLYCFSFSSDGKSLNCNYLMSEDFKQPITSVKNSVGYKTVLYLRDLYGELFSFDGWHGAGDKAFLKETFGVDN